MNNDIHIIIDNNEYQMYHQKTTWNSMRECATLHSFLDMSYVTIYSLFIQLRFRLSEIKKHNRFYIYFTNKTVYISIMVLVFDKEIRMTSLIFMYVLDLVIY